MFKVNNRDLRTTSVTLPLSIVDLEQVNVYWTRITNLNNLLFLDQYLWLRRWNTNSREPGLKLLRYSAFHPSMLIN